MDGARQPDGQHCAIVSIVEQCFVGRNAG